ncbi:DUF4132 domain-containing protein [Propioniciclava coleopterorum]|uniref:DUF4132 domain-containing protein n=1 Tax=Propioniciclava coleopterorum TaxID=2714937 RepID=A0A6G7Y3W6_9ACTN|nr:DUF4132 domain-containing protein [Propioniciclava coleopterorum]QIK71321.1 DUF4132 domain-containing protein [Propioniciclava coleopterorum]
MRTFSLVEGTSDKFWNIDVDGSAVTVNYGRTGTNGQTKTTQYDTAEKARTEADKLIASKVKKGYTEGSGGGAIAPVTPTVKKAAPAPAGASTKAAAPAAAPATPAAEPEPEPEPEWAGADHLEIRLTPVDRALLAGEAMDPTPLEADALAMAADPAARRAWLGAHTHPLSDYSYDVSFDADPFEGVPTADVASWWIAFGQGQEKTWASSFYDMERFGAMRERMTFANRDADSVTTAVPARGYNLPADTIVAALSALSGPAATLKTLAAAHSHADADRDLTLPALRVLIAPQLAPAERVMPRRPDQVGHMTPVPEAYTQAVHDLAEAVLFGSPDDVRHALATVFATGSPHAALVLAAVTVLPEEAERAEWLARVALKPSTALVHRLVVFGGPAAVDTVAAWMVGDAVDKTKAVGLFKALMGTIGGPGAVPIVIRAAANPRLSGAAVAWLIAHPRELVASTAPVPAGQRDLLRTVVRELSVTRAEVMTGPVANPFVADVLADLAEEAAMPTLAASAAPDWFTAALERDDATPLHEGTLKLPTKVPAWVDALPPLVVDGMRLDDELTGTVLGCAVRGVNDPDLAPRPLVAAVRERMRGKDRDAFALPLMSAFLTNGGKPADRVWFMAAGYLGADGFVHALTPLVREWPGQSQHARAVLGLDVLAATGTDAALQAISGIANKSKFKGVQAAAQESLAKLAALRGLTVDQLEDRVVPDADLDERGTRTLSYGPRSFRVSLSPQGKAVIRDLDEDGRPVGKPRTTLPAPNSKDDAELAAAAKADFALLRKQLTEVAKIQTARLEKAIVTGRTWAGDEHAELVARHPVLNALIRPLVWQVFAADGAPEALVRVTEEQDYVTVDEETYELPDGAVLALAHPLALPDEVKDAWRAHLVDHDLIAPLEQLDRATFELPAGATGTRLQPPAGTVNPGTLVSTLERMGWRRGAPADAGVVSLLWLPFETQDRAAVLDISDGLWTGMIHESGDQKLEGLHLCTVGQAESLWYVDDRDTEWLPWQDADPLLISEVLRSMAALAEKMA